MPLVEITMVEGRTKEQKVMLMKKLTDAVEESIAAPRESIRVVIREVPAAHWAVGGVPKG